MDQRIRDTWREYLADPTVVNYVGYASAANRAEVPFHCYFCKKLQPFEMLLQCDCESGDFPNGNRYNEVKHEIGLVYFCMDCAHNFVCGDPDCSAVSCPHLVEKCSMCQKGICPGDHNTDCSECRQETCLDCNRYCDNCDDRFCLDHLEPQQHSCLDYEDDDDEDDFGDDPYYRNPKQFGPKKLEAIRLCRETDMTYKEIARQIGASVKTISSWCIEAGAQQRQPRQRLSIRQRETLYPHRTSPLRQEMKNRWDKQATPSQWPQPAIDIEKARRMHDEGASFAEIALELGITWNEARRLDY